VELRQKERNNIDRAIEGLREQIATSNLSNNQFSTTVDYKNANEVLDDLANVEPVGRMVIELESILNGRTDQDIYLKDGDVLAVPNITPAVSVIGEVFSSSTFIFDKDSTMRDYVNMAGGVREYGDDSSIYIVRANGAVVLPQNGYWFTSPDNDMLQPGDTIVVPREVNNYESITLWQGVTQIIYQTAVAIAAIGSI
jgi:hypothetical protein